MGAGNVKAVYGLWGHLPDNPFRLLAFMALTSRDEDRPPRFWGGRETLAVGLGRDVPSGDDQAARRARRATFEAVRWTVQQLIEAGAIQRTRNASPGRTAEYALSLFPGMAQTQPVPNGADSACAMTHTESAHWPRLSLSMAQTESGPEEEQDYPGLNSGVATHHSAQPSVRATTTPQQHRYIEDEDGAGCAVCPLPAVHRVHSDRASA
jgi:hypothetical protein